MLIQDKVKQDKNKQKEIKLVHSSFFAKKEEYSSALRSSSFSSPSTSLYFYHNHRQIKPNLIIKNNLMLFYSTYLR